MNEQNQDFMPEGQPQGASDVSSKLQQVIEKFRELPPKTQMMIIGGVFVVLLIVFSGGNKPAPQQAQPAQQAQAQQPQIRPNTTDARMVDAEAESNFQMIDDERGSLQRGFFEEQRRIISERLGAVEEKVDGKMDEVKEIQASIAEQAKQLNQMIENFNEQMKSMEKVNKGSLDEIRKLAEESKNRSLRMPVQGGGVTPGGGITPGGGYTNQDVGGKKPLKQIILKPEDGGLGKQGDPLLGGFVGGGGPSGQAALEQAMDVGEAAPFIPPLGFVRGTLLNGFDALAGAGTPTPALVRLSGTYKTAMNSTVNLNGCFMLVEFEGDISTERALGKPARMTCVYPDQGAVAYDLNGYVVDEKDGIVGVPGIFYEGDPSRLAAAMLAEFTASIANIIQENQSTETTSAEGVEQSTLTGSETKAEIAGGVSDAMGSLSEYLTERANRIVPFIRVDTTRDIHVVILDGVELRHQGKPWTLLVSGNRVDELDARRKQALQQAQAARAQRGR